MPKWTGAPTDEPPKVIVVQQSTNVTMKKRLYDIRWYQPKDRYGIELFDEHKFSFSGRAIVILLEAVLTNANWPNVRSIRSMASNCSAFATYVSKGSITTKINHLGHFRLSLNSGSTEDIGVDRVRAKTGSGDRPPRCPLHRKADIRRQKFIVLRQE
jgi:hypothetical protein